MNPIKTQQKSMKRKLHLLSTGLLLLTSSLFAQSGITWNSTTDINMMSMYGNQHPRVVLDRSGDPMILWGNSGNNNAYFSKWNGASFSTPMIVNTGVPVFAASWAGPDIAAHGDTVYVVVKETPEMMNPAWMYKSFNGGTSFTGPVQLDINLSDSISRFPTVTTDNVGQPVVAYMKIDGSFLNARWVVTRSNDYGDTFGIDVLASGWSGGDVCDCCPASITCSGNNTAVMYRDENANIRDMWCGISNDAGSTFAGGFGLDNPDWMLMACPSTGPDGVIIGDTLYSALMSGFTGDYLIYYSKSSVSSMANSSVTPITGLLPGASTQNYPRVATDGSAVGIVWKQAISGQSQLAMIFTNDITNGFPSGFDTVDLDDVTNADIAIRDGVIHIVWEDPTSGTVKYRSGTFNSVMGVETITNENMVSCYPNPATSQINVQVANGYTGTATMSISNLIGEKVSSSITTLSNGKANIDVQGLVNGTYIIDILIENQRFVTRFVKN
jgi:hypothetical protein